MTDIDRLIDAVEAGEWASYHAVRALPAPKVVGNVWVDCPAFAVLAFDGSLDAAKRLHDALLPGWVWVLAPNGASLWREDDYGDPFIAPYAAAAPTLARAWLLAILKAYRSTL